MHRFILYKDWPTQRQTNKRQKRQFRQFIAKINSINLMDARHITNSFYLEISFFYVNNNCIADQSISVRYE